MTARLPFDADELRAIRPDVPLGSEDEDEDKAWADWWTQLPDFIKLDYPLDLPPCRMPMARYIFTTVGAPRFCPQASCRRAGTCKGGEGPPCFRADREALQLVLFMWWMMIYGNATDEDYENVMLRTHNRYAPREAHPSPAPRAASRRKRRRSDAAKSRRSGEDGAASNRR